MRKIFLFSFLIIGYAISPATIIDDIKVEPIKGGAGIAIVCDQPTDCMDKLYGNTLFITIKGTFGWPERGENVINKYGIKSIQTKTKGSNIAEIGINTYTCPNYIMYFENNVILIRVYLTKNLQLIFEQSPEKEVIKQPVLFTFKCSDSAKIETSTDSIECRYKIDAPSKCKTIKGYIVKNWSPWAVGDSGLIVLDSLTCAGKYTVEVEARYRNSNAEPKKIKKAFKLKL
jgi:hypothetical protein